MYTVADAETNSRIEVTVTACPGFRVEYSFAWQSKPADGRTVRCEGQVVLLRPNNKRADQLRTIAAESNGNIYAGTLVSGKPVQQLHPYQLGDVVDFGFDGRILRG